MSDVFRQHFNTPNAQKALEAALKALEPLTTGEAAVVLVGLLVGHGISDASVVAVMEDYAAKVLALHEAHKASQDLAGLLRPPTGGDVGGR